MITNGPYNIAAGFYDQFRPPYPVELINFVIGLASKRDEYVDLGCGTGALLFKVAPQFRRAVGVDADRSMLQQATAKRRCVECEDVVLIEQKAEDYLALRRPPLDLVTAGRSIHWMDQPCVMRRVHDLLNPDGVFALVGDRVSLWDRTSGPFRAIREVIANFEGRRDRPHLPVAGKDTSYQLTLQHLRESPFREYKRWDCAVEYVWDAEPVVKYFYSASGFLTWLGPDRQAFEDEAAMRLGRLSSDVFHDVIEFGVTFCRRGPQSDS